MKPVFPVEILAYSTEQHRFKNLKRHRIIYIILLLGLLAICVALPLIRIDLYKTSSGVIRSKKEINQDASPKNERNTAYFIYQNDGVLPVKRLETSNPGFLISSLDGASPQTDLVVECYLSPSDMALIKKDQKVKFRIHAFKQGYWGLASGHIIVIYRNLVKINDLHMYRILCSLDETNLFLNRTTMANLQKGMALTARFLLEKKSLLQLLFDSLHK